VGDLPPPTPDEAPDANADGGYEGRRDSIVSRPSMGEASNLGGLPEDDIEEEEEDFDDDDLADTGHASTSRSQHATPGPQVTTSSPHSLDPPSSSQQIAASLLPSSSRSQQPVPPQPNFNFNPSQSTSFDNSHQASLRDNDESRRYSVASVEAARRISVATSGFGSPGGTRGGQGEEADDEFEDSMIMQHEQFSRDSGESRKGRFSGISLTGSEGFGRYV
jgi:hypothetical protein